MISWVPTEPIDSLNTGSLFTLLEICLKLRRAIKMIGKSSIFTAPLYCTKDLIKFVENR